MRLHRCMHSTRNFTKMYKDKTILESQNSRQNGFFNKSYSENAEERGEVILTTPDKMELKTFNEFFVIPWFAPRTEKSKFIIN